jgi:hypothetical protein
MFCELGHDQTFIAKRFHLTQPRVTQILRANAISVIEHRKEWEKLKRINSMNKMLNNEKLPDANNKLDVLKELRKEFDGDSALVAINNVTQVISYGSKNPSPGAEVSGSTSPTPTRLPSEI